MFESLEVEYLSFIYHTILYNNKYSFFFIITIEFFLLIIIIIINNIKIYIVFVCLQTIMMNINLPFKNNYSETQNLFSQLFHVEQYLY